MRFERVDCGYHRALRSEEVVEIVTMQSFGIDRNGVTGV